MYLGREEGGQLERLESVRHDKGSEEEDNTEEEDVWDRVMMVARLSLQGTVEETAVFEGDFGPVGIHPFAGGIIRWDAHTV